MREDSQNEGKAYYKMSPNERKELLKHAWVLFCCHYDSNRDGKAEIIHSNDFLSKRRIQIQMKGRGKVKSHKRKTIFLIISSETPIMHSFLMWSNTSLVCLPMNEIFVMWKRQKDCTQNELVSEQKNSIVCQRCQKELHSFSHRFKGISD
jgi:hypothetical protein